MISEPIRLLDCVMVCDGANAVLVTCAGRPVRLAAHAVRILGFGERTNHEIADPCPTLPARPRCRGEKALRPEPT